MRSAHADDGLIGRWPRRLAALVCLALALLAATRQPTSPGPAGSRSPVAGPGQRTVPISISADPRTYLHLGDVVELLAAATADAVPAGSTPPPAAVVAARAVVMSIGQSNATVGNATWPLLVSVDEQAARQIAALNGGVVVAVLAGVP